MPLALHLSINSAPPSPCNIPGTLNLPPVPPLVSPPSSGPALAIQHPYAGQRAKDSDDGALLGWNLGERCTEGQTKRRNMPLLHRLGSHSYTLPGCCHGILFFTSPSPNPYSMNAPHPHQPLQPPHPRASSPGIPSCLARICREGGNHTPTTLSDTNSFRACKFQGRKSRRMPQE